MTFQANAEQTRVVDLERDLELFRRGPGPGAWNAFEIAGASTSIAFLANKTVTEETEGPPGDYSGQPRWQIYFYVKFSDEERQFAEELVAEAMIAYKSVFGFGVSEELYSVEFLPWSADVTN